VDLAEVHERARLGERLGEGLMGVETFGIKRLDVDVTVCDSSSSFTKVTVVPGATVSVAGTNMKFLM
jgi:hypothetical protein